MAAAKVDCQAAVSIAGGIVKNQESSVQKETGKLHIFEAARSTAAFGAGC